MTDIGMLSYFLSAFLLELQDYQVLDKVSPVLRYTPGERGGEAFRNPPQ